MSCHCVPSARTAGSASHGTSFDPHPVVHDRAFCRNGIGAPRRLPLAHDIAGARRNAIRPGVLSGFCEAIERVSA